MNAVSEARQLTENKFFQGMCESLKTKLFKDWCQAKDLTKREAIFAEAQALESIQRYMRATIAEETKK